MNVMQSDACGLLSRAGRSGGGRGNDVDHHDHQGQTTRVSHDFGDCLTRLGDEELVWSDEEDASFQSLVGLQSTPHFDLRELPFTLRNAPLLKAMPKFYGVVDNSNNDHRLLELEDVARMYVSGRRAPTHSLSRSLSFHLPLSLSLSPSLSSSLSSSASTHSRCSLVC